MRPIRRPDGARDGRAAAGGLVGAGSLGATVGERLVAGDIRDVSPGE
jgi:hypothetical protein